MLPGQTWTSYTGLWSSIMGPVGDAEFVTNYETYMRYEITPEFLRTFGFRP